MVNIEYKEQNNIFSLSVKGHCNLADKGKDVACAGVSTLVVALDKAIENNQHMLLCQPSIRIQNGYAGFYVMSKSKYKRQVKAIFETAAEGFTWLAEEFPDNIKII